MNLIKQRIYKRTFISICQQTFEIKAIKLYMMDLSQTDGQLMMGHIGLQKSMTGSNPKEDPDVK